jgi:phospholipid/cholesterol/gamma-HCH transport system substrate-binding protein
MGIAFALSILRATSHTAGRRKLADISRAVSNFDRNPSRVIFGGGNNAAPAAEAAPPPARPARPPAAAAAPSGQKRQ